MGAVSRAVGLLLCLARLGWADPVTLTWDAPLTGVAPAAYVMYRQVGTGAMVAIGTIDAPLVSYTDPAPALGANTYQVTATTLSGESPPSNAVTVTCRKGKGRERRCTLP